MGLDVESIRESLSLVIEREALITPRFYARLFARYPQVRPLFGSNETARQQKMLQEALVAVVDHIEDGAWLSETLHGMGKQHVDYGVSAEMYPWVTECLLETLAEIAGSAWTPGYQRAWEEALDAVSALMLAGAASHPGSG
jgi:hemoglobin-like flavoprotein